MSRSGLRVRSAALRVATAPEPTHVNGGLSEPLVRREDLRQAVREEKAGNLLILVVDASASMGVERRMGAVKGAVLSLLMDAYQRRDRVAVITFGGEDAEVVLRPDGEYGDRPGPPGRCGHRRADAAGGRSAGPLDLAKDAPATHQPFLILISDGRATWAPAGHDPLETPCGRRPPCASGPCPRLVLDVEDGHARLGSGGSGGRGHGGAVPAAHRTLRRGDDLGYPGGSAALRDEVGPSGGSGPQQMKTGFSADKRVPSPPVGTPRATEICTRFPNRLCAAAALSMRA